MNPKEKGSEIMTATYVDRQHEIILFCAKRALEQPILTSGLWHHHDIRNNFYDASYVIAAATNPSIQVNWNKEEAKKVAEQVLLQLLRLQDREETSPTYGHWPLNAHPHPEAAPKNPLPAELMGLLIVYLNKQYRGYLTAELQHELDATITTLYKSDFYKVPMNDYNHHEAKYTAAKLIYGHVLQDEYLLADGLKSITETLERLQQIGMTEYGCLPWFWHWVQAFTCAYDIVDDEQISLKIKEMLDYLWYERAQFYWEGTWVGAHSRSLPHDLPADGNLLFDYVQFGEIPFPIEVPRVEYAGLLYYAAPTKVHSLLHGRQYPHTIKKLVAPKPQASNHKMLHSYVYMTESYAAGGIWERTTEFDNEQMRWAMTFPATGDGQANRAYFFHPGQYFSGKESQDWRHQSDIEQVAYYKGAILAVYPNCGTDHPYIVGCLPHGTWLQDPVALYGQCGENYIAVNLLQPYTATEYANAWRIISEGSHHAVAMEVMSLHEAKERKIASLQQFATIMRQHSLRVEEGNQSVEYVTSSGDNLQLIQNDEQLVWDATVNKLPIQWEDYKW